jgi:hypothetical protein
VNSAKLSHDFLICHPLVFCDELVAFCAGGSWSTAARQIADAPFAIFEVLHPVSHIAATLARIPVDMIRLTKGVCSKIVVYKEFSLSI